MIVVAVMHREGLVRPEGFVKVAYVKIENYTNDLEACETAFVATQNIEGSWSLGPFIDGQSNADYNDNVISLNQSTSHGFRSSSVGDLFEVFDSEKQGSETKYICEGIGFKKL